MEISTLLILAFIGLAAGILGGMVGLGGGLIIIPGLVMLLGLGQKEAQGTSVAIMLPPIGILAAWNYYKSGYVNIKFAIIIAIAFILGGWIGSKAAIALPDSTVRKVFAGLMIITALKMIFSK
jgi:uncharacterized membrane protein YfcA